MNTTKMELFDEGALSQNVFYTVFSILFKTDINKWLEIISKFKSAFEDKINIVGPVTFDKSDLMLKGSQPEHFYLTGFDMPCWVNSDKANKKIMIIASEPLRSEDSWGDSDKYRTISLNTPFSFHMSTIDTNRNESYRYWNLINWLTEEIKATVYLTDIRKFWFAGWEHYKAFHGIDTHIDILLKELDFVKPDLIILFGSRPLNILQTAKLLPEEINLTKKKLPLNCFKLNYKEGFKVLPLIHPSGAAGGPRKEFFKINGVSGKDQNEMYKLIINRFVS